MSLMRVPAQTTAVQGRHLDAGSRGDGMDVIAYRPAGNTTHARELFPRTLTFGHRFAPKPQSGRHSLSVLGLRWWFACLGENDLLSLPTCMRRAIVVRLFSPSSAFAPSPSDSSRT
jgi:hypothetical protein